MLFYFIKLCLLFSSYVNTQLTNLSYGENFAIQDLLNNSISLDSNEDTVFDPITFRLPTALKPVEYFIKIFPVPPDERKSFRGYVKIEFDVMAETSLISLHMSGLELEKDSIQIAIFDDHEKKSINITNEIYYPEKEYITFDMKMSASVGNKIRFSSFYSGLLVNNSYGLNQYFYVKEDGTNKRFLATYFQPRGARRVFPCIDEPSFKSQFTLHVASHKDDFVLSNMPVSKSTKGDNDYYTWTEFEQSLPMSTYLVAILISDFKGDLSSMNQTTKVWSRKIMQKNTRYASSLAPKVLRWFESYFGVPYPLSKLDLVSLPSYPVAGMENFGLIFSQENSLSTNGKISGKEWVATVTAHEVAHQWIGNIVTPVWWSEYWLSEGFATYFAARALDGIEPELEATNYLITENVRLILLQDEGEQKSDLVVKTFDPLISNTKNIQIYYKGAAVVRMLMSVLGEELFSKGIKKYFSKYKFKSVSEDDFYSTLCEEMLPFNKTLPTTLGKIMETWTILSGFPLISVKKRINGTIALRQEHFEPKKSSQFDSLIPLPYDYNSYWWVPISYYTSRNPDFSIIPKLWLPPNNETMIVEEVTNEDSWVILNSQQAAYLRVNYDKSLWKEFSNQLLQDHNKIHLLNRAQLFEDSFHLFRSGFLDAEQPLDLMMYLYKEKHFIPFKAAFRSFSGIEIVMRGNIHYNLLKNFVSSIISPILETYFGKTDSEIKRYQLALSWACKFQSPNSTELAQKLFTEWKMTKDIDIFPEGAVDSLFCSAIEFGTNEDWKFAFDQVFSSTNIKGKIIIRNSLSCSRNKTTIQGYLDFLANGDHNLTYDEARDVLENLVRSVRWSHLTWSYLTNNVDQFKERFHGFPPIPSISTPYDFHQLVLILKTWPEYTEDIFKSFIEESKFFSLSASRTIRQVSDWLVKHAPFKPETLPR